MDADRAGSTAPYPDWLGDARRVLGAVDLPAIDLTVGYTSTSDLARVDHHQVFRGGRLESWDLGIPDDCDLHLRQPMST